MNMLTPRPCWSGSSHAMRRSDDVNPLDDLFDDLFHAAAFAAYLDEASLQQGPPDSERTRRRAFRYYEEELRFQKQMDRVQRTQALPKDLSIKLAAASRTIALGLPSEHASQSPTGSVQLYRPSDARMDRQIPLAVDAAGRQTLDAATLDPGLWKLRVTWMAGGKEYFHDTSLVIPAAKHL